MAGAVPPSAIEDACQAAGPAKTFAEAAELALARGNLGDISETDLQRVLTAAVKLYVARGEADGTFLPPVAPDKVTPTEVVLVVSEMLRAADLNLFDLAMWYRRGK